MNITPVSCNVLFPMSYNAALGTSGTPHETISMSPTQLTWCSRQVQNSSVGIEQIGSTDFMTFDHVIGELNSVCRNRDVPFETVRAKKISHIEAVIAGLKKLHPENTHWLRSKTTNWLLASAHRIISQYYLINKSEFSKKYKLVNLRKGKAASVSSVTCQDVVSQNYKQSNSLIEQILYYIPLSKIDAKRHMGLIGNKITRYSVIELIVEMLEEIYVQEQGNGMPCSQIRGRKIQQYHCSNSEFGLTNQEALFSNSQRLGYQSNISTQQKEHFAGTLCDRPESAKWGVHPSQRVNSDSFPIENTTKGQPEVFVSNKDRYTNSPFNINTSMGTHLTGSNEVRDGSENYDQKKGYSQTDISNLHALGRPVSQCGYTISTNIENDQRGVSELKNSSSLPPINFREPHFIQAQGIDSDSFLRENTTVVDMLNEVKWRTNSSIGKDPGIKKASTTTFHKIAILINELKKVDHNNLYWFRTKSANKVLSSALEIISQYYSKNESESGYKKKLMMVRKQPAVTTDSSVKCHRDQYKEQSARTNELLTKIVEYIPLNIMEEESDERFKRPKLTRLSVIKLTLKIIEEIHARERSKVMSCSQISDIEIQQNHWSNSQFRLRNQETLFSSIQRLGYQSNISNQQEEHSVRTLCDRTESEKLGVCPSQGVNSTFFPIENTRNEQREEFVSNKDSCLDLPYDLRTSMDIYLTGFNEGGVGSENYDQKMSCPKTNISNLHALERPVSHCGYITPTNIENEKCGGLDLKNSSSLPPINFTEPHFMPAQIIDSDSFLRVNTTKEQPEKLTIDESGFPNLFSDLSSCPDLYLHDANENRGLLDQYAQDNNCATHIQEASIKPFGCINFKGDGQPSTNFENQLDMFLENTNGLRLPFMNCSESDVLPPTWNPSQPEPTIDNHNFAHNSFSAEQSYFFSDWQAPYS